MRKRVLVIGAGAAGLMAACAAADGGASVTVLDHNEKAGKKLFITGKGRCNYTNACDTSEFFGNVLRNPKFLYSAVYGFDSAAMTQFLEENGCPVKTERGERCFPRSDLSYDVNDALVRHLRAGGGRISLHCQVVRILTQEQARDPEADSDVMRSGDDDRVQVINSGDSVSKRAGSGAAEGMPETLTGRRNCAESSTAHRGATAHGVGERRVLGAQLSDGRKLSAEAVIVATGGMSYPSTGSTGDGYRFARELGLAVNEPQPSLVPFVTGESWPTTLQGLSLKNVAIRVEAIPAASAAAAPPAGRSGRPRTKGVKPVYEGFGEMLFTHYGVSGPLILSASCHTDYVQHPEGYLLHLDLKPAMTTEEVARRLKREFEAAPGRELRSILRRLLPQRLSEVMADMAGQMTGQDPAAAVCTWNEREIRALAGLLKDVTMHLTGTRGFAEAIVTRGGVDVRAIYPSTMETRGIRGLYWAGEVLDVDAYTGGFNLQIAWSTGHLAGESAAADL